MRVVGSPDGPSQEEILIDAIYAVRTNAERNAITDGMFVYHLEATHSKDPQQAPQSHTLVVKADSVK